MISKTVSAVTVCLALILGTASAQADEIVIDEQATIRSFISQRVDSGVALRLRSGEELAGIVQSVGTDLVHLKNLKGREFYDAIVRMEDIAAVIVRNR